MRRRTFLSSCIGSTASFYALVSSEKRAAFLNKPGKEPNRSDAVVKVLGTVQDGGFPHFGCYCRNCRRARKEPSLSRFISSLAVCDFKEEKFFLLDATPDIRAQNDLICEWMGLSKKNTRRAPDGVLLTHAHIGHYTGLIFFGYEAISTHRLPVYCSSRMKDFLEKNGPWSQLVTMENISIQPLELNKKISLTPRISAAGFQVPHRDEYSDTLGFFLSGQKRSLLYIPDIRSWEAWERSVKEELRKVDIALLDGTFYSPEDLPGRDLSRIGHPFIQESLKTLHEAAREGRTEIYFTHLNHSNPTLDPDSRLRKKVEAQGFHIASDGMEFFL
ncbi:MAG: MBL fold metallo-hydrolase [Candidatus Aminicenantales bacterium]